MFIDDNMFAHYLKHWPINQSWHWWESFETKDTKRCILERCFWKLKMMSTCWKQGQDFSEVGTAENILKPRTIYGALWRYLKRCSWRWNCWENFKSKNTKRCILALFEWFLGSWNCWENLESKEKSWCILMLFETVAWKLELLKKMWKQES